jgi:DNA gyrase/topoisomerase IV subunit B
MTDAAQSRVPDLFSTMSRVLVLYSLAEFQSGHASTIRVLVNGTTCSVADDGRGHAIHRVVSGQPYLPFIYTHQHYPFQDAQPHSAGQVQLQGMGMSLVNALCSELLVVVKKREGTLRLTYASGRLTCEERDDLVNESTGTSVSATLHPALPFRSVDLPEIERWLTRIAAAHPTLKLSLNDAVIRATAG